MDGYLQAPVPQQTTIPTNTDISKAPKWLKRPVSAKFGVSFVLKAHVNFRLVPQLIFIIF